MKYQAKFTLKISERDNFSEGCDLFTSETRSIDDLTFQSENMAQLLRNICNHFNVRINSILLNSCDEIGRIDVQTYTKTLSGNRCTYHKHEQGFKNGEFDLWLNCFIGEVTTIPQSVDLSDPDVFKL